MFIKLKKIKVPLFECNFYQVINEVYLCVTWPFWDPTDCYLLVGFQFPLVYILGWPVGYVRMHAILSVQHQHWTNVCFTRLEVTVKSLKQRLTKVILSRFLQQIWMLMKTISYQKSIVVYLILNDENFAGIASIQWCIV